MYIYRFISIGTQFRKERIFKLFFTNKFLFYNPNFSIIKQKEPQISLKPFHTNYLLKRTILHSPHLLCELFDGMPGLCGGEGNSVFGLPVFWLVKIFCLLFSSPNQLISEVGKIALKVGKQRFLL